VRYNLKTKWLRRLSIFLGLVYVIWPLDIIPDFLGLLGMLDEFVLLIVLFLQYRYFARKWGLAQEADSGAQNNTAQNSQYRQQEQHNNQQQPSSGNYFDPYEVLKLKPGASRQEIDKQYRSMVAKYHPDKVTHLGDEFQQLAHEKMLVIQRAYELLK